MDESIRILAVTPKQKNQEDLLGNVVKSLEDNTDFTVLSREINSAPHLQIYDKTVQLMIDLTFKNNAFSMRLEKRSFSDENVIMELTIFSHKQYTGLADELYQLKLLTKTTLNTLFKGVYWQKDTQNEKVCAELYASIHVLENRFREVIVKFMVNKFGFDWTRKLTSSLVDKIQLYSKWYRDNYDDFKSVKTEIFNLQINDLIALLEAAYEKQIISESDFTKSITKEGLGAEEIKQLIEQYKENATIKSVWEKYFLDALGDNFPNDWEFLKNTRNMVAHNKPVCLKLYSDTNGAIEKLTEVFDGVEEKFNNIFITREDIEIENLWFEHEIQERYADFEEIYLEEAGIEPLPSEEDVLEEITEHEDIQQIFNISEEYVHSFRSLVEETRELLENGSDNLDFSAPDVIRIKLKDFADLFYRLYRDLPWGNKEFLVDDVNELNDFWYELKTAFEGNLYKLESAIDRCKLQDKFIIEDKIISLFSHSSALTIETRGFISPEKASADNVYVELAIDSVEVAYGELTRYYGDYEIEDTGAAVATHSDGLWISINEVLDKLSEYTEASLDYITSIRDDIEGIF
ncbi:hypothetical protein [Paenibacillus chitinolyticus]|uniref:hypothetical protein n=1 Tax=Paenibacillus chitinolyticus TaxID=79263 RepID=UPI003636AD8B